MQFGQNIVSSTSYKNKEAEFWLETIPRIQHPYLMSNTTVTSLVTSTVTSLMATTRDSTSARSCKIEFLMPLLSIFMSLFIVHGVISRK